MINEIIIMVLIFIILFYLLYQTLWLFFYYIKSYKRGILYPIYPKRGLFPFGSNLIIKYNNQQLSNDLIKEIYSLKHWRRNKEDLHIVEYDKIKFTITLLNGIIASGIISIIFIAIIIYIISFFI